MRLLRYLFAALALACSLPAHTTDGIEFVVEAAGFVKPESVIHDTRNDVYLVSNINGLQPGTAGKGFISRIAPDGTVLALKWIDGGAPGTELDHPAGLAIAGDVLYVADSLFVRLFRLADGKPLGKAELPQGTSANSLAALPDGSVLATCSAWNRHKLGSAGDIAGRAVAGAFRQFDGDLWMPNGRDAVLRIAPDLTVSILASSPALKQPNGIRALPSGNVLTVSSNSGELYELTPAGERANVRILPHRGFFDGVGATPDGKVFVSFHHGLYRIHADGQAETVFDFNSHIADFGFDLKRGRILLPAIVAGKLIVARIP
ncbi:MAG: hypothetical protein LBO79_02700 [Zoogloeaceae bacterium]|jgi:hypothetical protein|nr:hypothetical protein [Zoogloeaceae bacterium]